MFSKFFYTKILSVTGSLKDNSSVNEDMTDTTVDNTNIAKDSVIMNNDLNDWGKPKKECKVTKIFEKTHRIIKGDNKTDRYNATKFVQVIFLCTLLLSVILLFF